ncbi:SusC/RagA family TonB-linked outer membrane protein [Mucilaginibacter corticis]|uniref:SusC/RagA family TonB-linked outer membrane protein n=1 Tax=Mucilaginibacter corticis TaxID=2597670 RepID=A0A556MGY0_9SPHI|nr:SusC/RagA family TonB-linked outer membrane protein [Mucilaginibacter corticis]TSJ39148.1 SusC/RagA family TonB-linked outer membrane protein [Mucilaginibacter corticis]
MKKTLSYFIDPAIGKKILLCVKLTTFFILIALMHVSAAVRSQDKLDLTVKNVKFDKLFEMLEQKSSYTFLYNNQAIAQRKVTIDVKDVTVPQILDNAFKNTGLSFRILNNNLIVITRQSAPQTADITIKGKVVDTKGEPLPGATIAIKNGSSITQTDADGNFTVTVPDNTILVVTYIGFKTQEVETAGKSAITITLTEDAGNLNEVIVTGYGTQRKKDLTGAVSVISTKDLAGIPVGGVDQIIQGKAAGVTVTQNNGAPGGGISVQVRGLNTINGITPLYIIDGVPVANSPVSTTNGNQLSGIDQLAPDDIESINILKDASSAAIYGARAAGGVVIITTKHGSEGKAKLSVNAYTGVQSATHLIKMANNAQYVSAYNMAAKNDGRPGISDSLAATLSDVNWLKKLLRPAPVTNINLSVSGGNATSNYIVSGNVFSQNGLIENSSFRRYNLRTAINSSPTKYLKFGTNLNLVYEKTRVVGSSGDGFTGAQPSVVRYALFRTPGTPVYGPNGQFVDLPKQNATLGNFLGDGINPIQLAASTDDNHYNYSVLGDVFGELTPIKNLRIKSDLGVNLRQVNYKQFFGTYGADRSFNTPASLAQTQTLDFTYNWTNTANYDLKLDKHDFSFIVGTETVVEDVQDLSASRVGFVNQTPDFQYLSLGGLAGMQNGGIESSHSLSSLFGRVNYQYNNKYLASFNYRWDASSKLDPTNRSKSVYSGSLGWRIDQEDFMKDIKPISNLKLRVDVGQLGNEQALNDYPYLSTFFGNYYYPFNSVTNQGSTIGAIGNPKIQWEVTTQQDIGLDIGLFNSALQITADYYIKNTNNVLLPLQLPSSAGQASAPFINAGKVRDQGFELDINYRTKIGNDWNIGINGNLATEKNEVVSLGGNPSLPGGRIDNGVFATRTDVGHPIGSFYLLQQEGIFQNTQQIFTHAYQGPGVRPGDVMYKDVNGDGVIDGNDRVFAGSAIPKLTYGLTTNVSYKNWDLSVFFQGVYGNKIYDQVMTELEGFYRPFNITQATATQSWTGPGTSNSNPLLSWSDAANNKQPSTRFLESGSYLKLKNVQLGYRLGKNALKPLGLSSVRIYVSGQNLLTFTKYKGLDPEQYFNDNNAGDNTRGVGIDWGTYPSALILTAGINANF